MDKLEKALEKARRLRGGEQKKKTTEAAPLEPVSYPVSGLTSLQEAILEKNRIVAHRTRSAEADAFRILRTQALQAMEKTGARTLAVTSPNYGDGKTTVAINLAVSIALDLNQTVLLVDLDLRKPCVAAYLGLDEEAGLTDYLSGYANLPDCLRRLSFERMTVLPAGSAIDNSSETLGSPQMAALANELKSRYEDRLIIYDMPPILAQDDPIAFMPYTESVLLVVQDGVTRIEDIKRSLDILSSANVIGTVLNDGV